MTETPTAAAPMPDATADPDHGATMPVVPVAEGVFDGIPEDAYRSRRALSYSGAKLLLPPNCPALFRWRMDNPPPPKDSFDFGHAAHKELLGQGQPIRYINEKTWQTKAAKDGKAEAYAAGEIPLLEKDRGVIEGMVSAVRAHPLASRLFEAGEAEQSLFWQDEETGVNLRARLDWLTYPAGARNGSRAYCVDYKTSITANPSKVGKIVSDFGYQIQDVFYRAGLVALDVDPDPAFLFTFQEKTPPYLVSVVEIDEEARSVGRQLMRQAIEIYQRCMENDDWPGYPGGVSTASLPYWYVRNLEMSE